MKGKSLFAIALFTIVAGVALIFMRGSITSYGIVITGGVLFILAGLFNMAVFLGAGEKEKKERGIFSASFNWISSAAAAILGLSMIIFQGTFAALIPFMFGVLIAFGALYQFYLLGYGCRPATLPGWLFIMPTLLAAAAIYLFVQRNEVVEDRLVMLITGICLLVFGVTTLIESVLIGRYNHARLHPSPKPLDAASKPLDESAGSSVKEPDAPKSSDSSVTGSSLPES